MERIRTDIDERCRLADVCPFAWTAFFDGAVGGELSHEVGNGHAGEPRFSGEVCAAHGTVVEEALKHERPVVQPVVFRKGLGGGAQSTAYSLRPVSWWRCGAQCARLLPASLLCEIPESGSLGFISLVHFPYTKDKSER